MIINGAIGDAVLADFEAAIVPGIREYELLAVINESLFRNHGEFMFTRLVAPSLRARGPIPGCPRPTTSSSSRAIWSASTPTPTAMRATSSTSRATSAAPTFLCGDEAVEEGQKEAYRIAYDCVNGMRELMKPGMSFEEFSRQAPELPDAYKKGRYGGMCHQAGLEDEGPGIPYPDVADEGIKGIPDREIQENMVFCLECYAGKDGAPYGVKLEDQVLVTKDGAVVLSTYPFEAKLL